jgi:hypothetical protein
MTTQSRRDVLRGTGVAALAVGAAAVVPFAAQAGGGELAALCRLYWQQVDEFNSTDHYTDEHSDRHAAETYERTVRLMTGAPARNAEDALAAIDWLIKKSPWFHICLSADDCDHNNDLDCLTVSLIGAVRGYVA